MEVNGQTLIRLVEETGKHTQAVHNLEKAISELKKDVTDKFEKLPCICRGKKLREFEQWKILKEKEEKNELIQKGWNYKKIIVTMMAISIFSSICTTLVAKVF